MNNIVLDTDIFVDYLRGFEKSQNYFKKIRDGEFIVYFSAITEAELINGKECKKIEKKNNILEFISHFTKVSVNNEIAVKAGDFSREYNTELPDSIIAATAFVMKATLITRNVADYKRINNLKIGLPY